MTPALTDADKEVRDTYVENRDDMTTRGLRDMVRDMFDEIEKREMPDSVREADDK